MAQQFETVRGIDFTLPAAPPLVQPPLSLLSESRSLIDLDGLTARRQRLVEQMASAAAQLEAYDRDGIVGDDDQPGEADSAEDARKALEQQLSEWTNEIASLDTAIKDQQRFEGGFVYLPELSDESSLSVFSFPESAITNPTQAALKTDQANQELFAWADPFTVVAKDKRSAFGWPNTDYASRAQRASRALLAHESWQVENEWWSGTIIPTNYHLTASQYSPATSVKRTLVFPFPTPTPAPGTELGTAASLSVSLAALDQAIADAEAGVGMIHATPYVVQQWAKAFPYLRDSQGNVRTVNNNLLVPGYGYAGTGPDQANRTLPTVTVTATTGKRKVVASGGTFSTFDIGHQIIDVANVYVQTARLIALGLTAGSSVVTATTTTFTTADVGRTVVGPGIPPGTTIASKTSGSAVTLSQEATVTTVSTATVGTDTYIVAVLDATHALLSQPGTQEGTDPMQIVGTGGRATGAPQQWAYATEQTFHLRGDVMVYPNDLREMSPTLPVDNSVPVRAERTHSIITNKILRAAVLVDTTTV